MAIKIEMLRTFAAVAQTGNLPKAATRLITHLRYRKLQKLDPTIIDISSATFIRSSHIAVQVFSRKPDPYTGFGSAASIKVRTPMPATIRSVGFGAPNPRRLVLRLGQAVSLSISETPLASIRLMQTNTAKQY